MAKRYTIGELMAIDSVRQQKAQNCAVFLEKTYHELKKKTVLDKFKSTIGREVINQYFVIFEFRVKSDTGHEYKVYIKVNPDFDLSNWNSNTCSIYCSCPDFKYRSAYLLKQRKSLFLNDSLKIELGQAAEEAPKKVSTTLLCKHAYAALHWLSQNYSSVMKTI